MSEPRSSSAYDEVPYPGGAHPQTHPSRLAAIGHLYGLDSPPVERCRVLEIGCAAGANLIPMAYAMPLARFVGTDLSKRQIEMGRQRIAALDLSNIELMATDVVAGRGAGSEFDYIIVHGVYSWVAHDVRRKILDAVKSLLALQGLAYVSYNALPGGHQRRMIRDMLLYHARAMHDPAERAREARWFLDLLADSIPASHASYALMIQDEREALRHMPDEFFFHDQLEEHNDPQYLHEFTADAARHGLRYVAESSWFSVRGARFAQLAMAWVEKAAHGSTIAREQYLDFVRGKTFRQSVLCHDAAGAQAHPVHNAVRALNVTSRAKCQSATPELASTKPEEFQSLAGVTLGTDHPLTKAALVCLEERWPSALAFAELVRTATERLVHEMPPSWTPSDADLAELAESLCVAFSEGVVDVHAWRPNLTVEPGDAPQASRVARLQARDEPQAVNLWHETHAIDPIARQLLCLLDGKHSRSQLLDELDRAASTNDWVVLFEGRAVTDAAERRRRLHQGIDSTLASLARAAFLSE